MHNKIKEEICREDFYEMFKQAVIDSGGNPVVERYKKMTLEEVANNLANNGIRIVYMKNRHISALDINWKEKESTPNGEKKLLTDRWDIDAQSR